MVLGSRPFGGVAEWSKAAVLKTAVRQRTGSSNLSSSADIISETDDAPDACTFPGTKTGTKTREFEDVGVTAAGVATTAVATVSTGSSIGGSFATDLTTVWIRRDSVVALVPTIDYGDL